MADWTGFAPLPPYGPTYPDLGVGVAKFRRLATVAGGLCGLAEHERKEYGRAVAKAIRSLQRSALMRTVAPLPGPTPMGEARRNMLRAAFQRACANDFKNGVKGLHEWPHTARCKCEICRETRRR